MKGYVTSIKPCIGAVKVFTHHATREGAGQIQRKKQAGQIQPKAKKQKSKKAKKQKSKKAKKQKSIDPQMLIFMYGLF
jgi:hypothetical protein